MVFCVNVAHVQDLTNEFRARGIDARYLHAKTPGFERKALLDGFRAGEFPVLVNCGRSRLDIVVGMLLTPSSLAILTEGADVPNIDCVIVAKPTRSRNIFAQMVIYYLFSLLIYDDICTVRSGEG